MSCDTSQQIACDSCQLTIAWTPKIKDVAMIMVVLSQSQGISVETDGSTDNRVTAKFFKIDGLPNYLRYGAPLARVQRAGAPL